MPINSFRKDESLNRLADSVNVAQFVSYPPARSGLNGYSRVLGFEPNFQFPDLQAAIFALLQKSPEGTVNVRSFSRESLRSNEFLYGLSDAVEINDAVTRITEAGFFAIINETVDVNDGGVSGVVQNGVIEFSPDDTPRCVEKPGTASLSISLGNNLLKRVYGFSGNLGQFKGQRFEFSVHPRSRGWKQSNVLGWELEDVEDQPISPTISWPNNFSRLIGDKAFGLLLAAELGLPVPLTTVISRRIAPFSFGTDTGDFEWWIRTCPVEQVAGRFTTRHGWLDPYKLLAEEDPEGKNIASVLAQRNVPAQYSGAAIVDSSGELVIEGLRGEGEMLMLGKAEPEQLPPQILVDINALYSAASEILGPVRFEWVHDGQKAWIVQLHRGATSSNAKVIVPGEPQSWREFEVARGLEALRSELKNLGPTEGIALVGKVGLTSHVADLLRKAGHPARVR